MNNSLKQQLGKAAYQSLIDSEIRTIRRIVYRTRMLSKWYTGNDSLLTKAHRLFEYLSYGFHYTRHLTDRHFRLAYGQKGTRFDKVDFIRNQYSPYLPR